MAGNNAILFTFMLIFLLIGFLSPIMYNEFEAGTGNDYNTDSLDDVNTDDLLSITDVLNIKDSAFIQVILGVFLWSFGAPIWLNFVLILMRIIFIVIVWDKIRGIGS